MKIAILGLRGLPSSYSGYETFVKELAPMLVERGHDVTVYCRSNLYAAKPPKYDGVRLIYLPCINHKIFSTVSHTALAITHASLGQAEVIFVINAANGMLGWIPRLCGKPCVLNVDGMEWLRPKWNRFGQMVFKLSARLGCLFFNEIVTDAAEMHRVYARNFGIDSVYIAYGAHIESSLHPEILREYDLEPGEYLFGAGRLVPDNNADLIIQGFLASGSRRVLAIAGGADYRGNEKEQAYLSRLKSLSNNQVRFLGHISKPGHFRELHTNCYAYIHGHEYGGLNPSLLQAMGYGNCILALDTPFSREALSDGEFGSLYEKCPLSLGEAIKALELNQNRAEAFRRKVLIRVKDFGWDKITDQYAAMFKSLLSRSAHSIHCD